MGLYTSVRRQKGRVETDQDWNENTSQRRGRFRIIVPALRPVVPAASPEWTDHNDSDAGITLLELSAFLAIGLLVGLIARRFHHIQSGPTLLVTVDGEDWHRVEILEDAGPDDSVYRVDPESGTIEFGDGQHGRKPEGTVNIWRTYDHGVGAAGAIGIISVVYTALATWWCRRRRGRQAA